MTRPFAAFFAALRFFTRIPVPSAPDDSRQHLERALPYFPLIGILVGGIGASITALALQLLSPALAVLAEFPGTGEEVCARAGRVVVFNVARVILKMAFRQFGLGIE